MTFRRTLALLLTIVISVQAMPIAQSEEFPFPDLGRTWFVTREAISKLKDRGVLGGYPDGTFRPMETMNRAELLKIVFKGKSDVVPVTRRCFSDVNTDEWYAPYVCAAKNRGIVSGYRNGTFRPGEPVNTAEAMKIIMNAYGIDVSEGNGVNWYEPYIKKLDELEILPEDARIPWAKLTRAHAADLLGRILFYQEERVIPRFSAGCGKAPTGSMPTSVVVNATTRSFLLSIPRKYVSHDPSPLIVAFHGRTNSNEQVRSYMGLDREMVDSFIAYPAALRSGNGSYSWANPGDSAEGIRDIALFDAIVEVLAKTYCIDMDRISVVGHSLGAWMANSVACVRGDVVMASATVGGDSVQTLCAGPAAAMIIHHPKDNLASFSGAERVRDLRTTTNVCTGDTESVPGTSLQCVRSPICAGGNVVLFCPHAIDTDHRGAYYPHVWPKTAAGEIREFLESVR